MIENRKIGTTRGTRLLYRTNTADHNEKSTRLVQRTFTISIDLR